MKTAILFARSEIVLRNVLQPIIRWRRRLADRGLHFTFHNRVTPRLFDNDCIVLCDYFYPAPTIYGDATLAFVRSLKQRVEKVVFFDNRDSCGNTHFELLGIVDSYWKKQVYRDTRLYLRPPAYSRLYCDYMQQTFGIAETLQEHFAPLPDPDSFRKVKIAWNIGVGPLFQNSRVFNKLNYLNFAAGMPMPLSLESSAWKRLYRPADRRGIDIQFRGGKNMIINSLSFGRTNVDTLLTRLASTYRIAFGASVPPRQFMREVFDARMVISPYGYGEVCYRDFEAFAAGACMVKPDMGHIETWPDFYQPDITYVPYAWDFSDFVEKVASHVRSAQGEAVAREGRRRYLLTQEDGWGEVFCQRVASLLESGQ